MIITENIKNAMIVFKKWLKGASIETSNRFNSTGNSPFQFSPMRFKKFEKRLS